VRSKYLLHELKKKIVNVKTKIKLTVLLIMPNLLLPAVVFGLKFADNMHYKFRPKSSQALKARIQSSKNTGAKQNLTQSGHSRSFKVTCFRVSGKANKGLNNTI